MAFGLEEPALLDTSGEQEKHRSEGRGRQKKSLSSVEAEVRSVGGMFTPASPFLLQVSYFKSDAPAARGALLRPSPEARQSLRGWRHSRGARAKSGPACGG